MFVFCSVASLPCPLRRGSLAAPVPSSPAVCIAPYANAAQLSPTEPFFLFFPPFPKSAQGSEQLKPPLKPSVHTVNMEMFFSQEAAALPWAGGEVRNRPGSKRGETRRSLFLPSALVHSSGWELGGGRGGFSLFVLTQEPFWKGPFWKVVL